MSTQSPKSKTAAKTTAAKRPRGRPTVMTPDKEKEILAIRTMGGSRNVAADYVGIAQGTLHDCIKRNADFSERVKNAEAKGQIRHLKKVSEPFPAGAGMNRPSRAARLLRSPFPAGAGMNRSDHPSRSVSLSVPRRRGDEPYSFFAFLCLSPVPRRRGDEPQWPR